LGAVTVDLSRALDLEQRLHDTPPQAAVRGAFVRLLEDSLARRGLSGAMNLPAIMGERPRSYRLYSARKLLVAYATAGALLHPKPEEGIRLIFSEIATPFASSWYGQAFRRFLKIDPFAGLKWLDRAHDSIVNYGTWRAQSLGPGRAIFHMIDEYFWIEHAHRGGCEGMLKACGVEGEVRVELETPYCGRLDVRWKVPN
jgi:uncharacterized protein (TIGR02265 family)